MQLLFRWTRIRNLAVLILLLSGSRLAAQTADQTLKAIPQQVQQSGATKASTKTNTVSNNAMNSLDSASDKAFKGFTNLFKKKKKKAAATDSVKAPTPDTTAAPVKSTGKTDGRASPYVAAMTAGSAEGQMAYVYGYIRRPTVKQQGNNLLF